MRQSARQFRGNIAKVRNEQNIVIIYEQTLLDRIRLGCTRTPEHPTVSASVHTGAETTDRFLLLCQFQSIQCILKVFRPLDIFHILLSYNLIVNGLKYFSPSSIYTQYSIMTNRKQVYRNYCKCITNKKQKDLIYISIHTFCYETRN